MIVTIVACAAAANWVAPSGPRIAVSISVTPVQAISPPTNGAAIRASEPRRARAAAARLGPAPDGAGSEMNRSAGFRLALQTGAGTRRTPSV